MRWTDPGLWVIIGGIIILIVFIGLLIRTYIAKKE
jgi:hypothetical protein